MEVFELKILDPKTGKLTCSHSLWSTQEYALEGANLMGFERAEVQPRQVLGEEDLAKMEEGHD